MQVQIIAIIILFLLHFSVLKNSDDFSRFTISFVLGSKRLQPDEIVKIQPKDTNGFNMLMRSQLSPIPLSNVD